MFHFLIFCYETKKKLQPLEKHNLMFFVNKKYIILYKNKIVVYITKIIKYTRCSRIIQFIIYESLRFPKISKHLSNIKKVCHKICKEYK